MPVHLHTLTHQIGIYTRSRERFLAIAKALNEPCVWLGRENGGNEQHDYEVVIIDAQAASPSDERCAGIREEDAGQVAKGAADRRQSGLMVYQCQDGVD